MKKMIIAAAIVFVAALAQAAAVTWTSVQMYNDANAKVGANATLYVYALESLSGVTDAWATYGDDVLAGGKSATNAGGTKSVGWSSKATTSTIAAANTTYYAAVIATIGTGENMKYYAELATVTTGDDGNAQYVFGDGVLNTAAGAASAWKPATGGSTNIPEPTSGLLLVVGGALLALRRRQK